MPISLTLNNSLVNYARGVFADSYHHAPSVTPVLPHIFTCLVMYADPGSIAVRASNRGLARECWFTRNGVRYCFSYVHDGGGRIDQRVCRRSRRQNADSHCHKAGDQRSAHGAPRPPGATISVMRTP